MGNAYAKSREPGLIAACRKFDDLERDFNRAADAARNGTLPDEIADATTDAQAPLVEIMTKVRARTLDGLLARARTLLQYDVEMRPERLAASPYLNERLLGLLLRDLIAFEGYGFGGGRSETDAPTMPRGALVAHQHRPHGQ